MKTTQQKPRNAWAGRTGAGNQQNKRGKVKYRLKYSFIASDIHHLRFIEGLNPSVETLLLIHVERGRL